MCLIKQISAPPENDKTQDFDKQYAYLNFLDFHFRLKKEKIMLEGSKIFIQRGEGRRKILSSPRPHKKIISYVVYWKFLFRKIYYTWIMIRYYHYIPL